MKSHRRWRGDRKGTREARRRLGVSVTVLLVMAAAIWAAAVFRPNAPESQPRRVARDGTVHFTDARQQAAEFIGYDRAITLTLAQKKIMNDGLGRIPAPCCKQYSIATCCCPCNLARSTWGLAKLLITEHGADAMQVQAAAADWIRFTNPGGYTGDACFKGGCVRSFENNGCGGMNANWVH